MNHGWLYLIGGLFSSGPSQVIILIKSKSASVPEKASFVTANSDRKKPLLSREHPIREEGELGSWGAHLAIDHASKENLRNRHFWPGRVYARPWNFRNHNLLDAPREGDSRPNLAAESPPAGPPGEARPQNN